ncbi:MAG TPA: hypothetical protein PLT20_06425 [Sedimentisphaerales bacterium]|nr:hypothetical protein [Sedimentisphaerales bacterium]
MEPSADAIFEAAMMLPEGERLTLASRLLETASAEDDAASLDDAALADELDRRFADREGEIPWSDLRTEG